MAIGSSLTGN